MHNMNIAEYLTATPYPIIGARPAYTQCREKDDGTECQKCNRCEKVKPVASFWMNGNGRRATICRECARATAIKRQKDLAELKASLR